MIYPPKRKFCQSFDSSATWINPGVGVVRIDIIPAQAGGLGVAGTTTVLFTRPIGGLIYYIALGGRGDAGGQTLISSQMGMIADVGTNNVIITIGAGVGGGNSAEVSISWEI
jgi:hypothetical protein